nr:MULTISPECIES: hypothetical protein [unclassified Streptomyces]
MAVRERLPQHVHGTLGRRGPLQQHQHRHGHGVPLLGGLQGPEGAAEVTTGSGSHGPTYCSRRALAEVSRVRQRLVTTLASQAAG